jgi:rhodanese-related sulfurtransferase
VEAALLVAPLDHAVAAHLGHATIIRMGGRRTIDDLLAEARERIQRVEPGEAAALVDEGALLVDIRSESQRERDGVIPGALYHPRNVLEWRMDPDSGHSDPAVGGVERRVIVVCDAGYQSSLAAASLRDIGFARAADLVGGFQAWRDAGLPVEGGPAASTS